MMTQVGIPGKVLQDAFQSVERGSENYDPSLPWISKIDDEGLLACDLHQYVDDLRITVKDAALAWRASSRVAKICSFLGLQDAARKRRAPSQERGQGL
mmetsp:Transcript_6949/g.10555  ORF Transcript_6949/g.10555 Transcript_6949/m.10555 type:complete len:98 (+) Transcript_6949:1353-1646(+)